MIKLVFILCCIFFADFSVRYVYAQEGSACYTPRRDIGICINFKQCDPLLQLLLDNKQNLGVHDYLRASTCGYIGNDPLVCCEQTTNRNENNKPDVMIFSNGNQNIPKLPSKPQCGLSNVTNPRIVGGVPAKLNEFPFMAILGYRNKVNPNIPKWLCGGTLITERHILTAAHCAYNRNDLYLARVGELILFDDNDGASPDDIPITNIKMHENFSTVQFTDDIAILTLSRKTTNPLVWPICLPTDDTMKRDNFLGYTGVVTGWGSLYFDGPRSSSLQVADMPILNESNCKKAFGQTTVIDDRVICAGWISGARDTCQGDSGGPIMIGIKEGKQVTYYQIGVISYGFRCAEQGYPGVFTRVTKYLDWIQKNV